MSTYITQATAEDIADQAMSEHESGVVTPDSYEQGWLAGVEHALRYAFDGSVTHQMAELLDRMARADATP